MTDAAVSVVVGGEHTNPEAAHLLETTREGLKHCVKYL